MRKLRLRFLSLLVFLVTTGQSPALRAHADEDLASAIETDLQLIAQLDQFNQHVSQSYVDCASGALSGEAKKLEYNRNKINHLGAVISEPQICADVINKLKTRSDRMLNEVRVNLALIRTYRAALAKTSLNLHLERPQNRTKLRGGIIQRELEHLESLVAESEPLESLTDTELETALDKHFAFADATRRKFVRSANYRTVLNALNPEYVVEYLTSGESGNLANDVKRVAKTNPMGPSPWLSIPGIVDLYRGFLAAEKRRFVAELEDEYRRDLNALPILSYLRTAHPELPELLIALRHVQQNARDRASDSMKVAKAFIDRPRDADESYWISDYLSVMDHGLSRLYLSTRLQQRHGWSDTKSNSIISHLDAQRTEQKKNRKLVQTGLMVAGTVACLVPYPGTRLATLGAKLLFRNFCLLGVSGGLNTYFVIESDSVFEKSLRTFLSTPDGWNQMTKLNQVLEQKKERDSWVLFYAFEFLPAFEIGKFLLRL